ncbi:type II toxin-antitoxin system Phd/YefM family antitoxin [Bifidobacterium parmae]|uniref:Antitoxin n=1 Tax=Bifidobacterium parmae TaxID=361854 RepID=A0A2N5J5Z4_9BIFI|nr:type II toxin-antitoxin system Phd/YefM family antitoxin [Bifidobacterium parmae]PLS29613.1 prevent-host-death family protein [Bifidobacterium parmae]
MSVSTLPRINQTVSISDLNRGKATETCLLARKAPVVVLNRNKPTAVILDIDQYNRIQEYLEDMDDARMAEERLDHWNGTAINEHDVMRHAGITEADIAAAPEVEFE